MSDLNDISLDDLITGTPEKENVEKSPLEKMKEMKENNKGLIVNNSDVTYDNQKKDLKNSIENDRREKDFDEYLSDMDQKIEAAKNTTLLRQPTNVIEEAAMIDQLDRIARQRSGTVIENPHNDKGEEIDIGDEQRNGTDIDLPEGYKNDFFTEKKDNEQTSEINEQQNTEENVDDRHEQLVTVLIDKTGLGTEHIDFTEEERNKITSATEIRVTEVETIDIDAMVFDAPENTYVESIESADETLGTTTVPLVASRYRAKMKGLGYGQLGDLMLNGNEPTFEQHYKRLSTIYNNIAETTIGKFESFEDFLKKTAWVDVNTLLYGLVVSTYPEVDSVIINCGRCGHRFEQKYFVRDLMDLRGASTDYLMKLDELMECAPEKFEEFEKGAPIFKRKYIVLPNSKYVVEIGLVSAYDYLYTVLSNYSNGQFKKTHPDDVNSFLEYGINFMMMVRSISIPKNGDPKRLVKYTNFEDLVQILYRLQPDDQQILNGLLSRYGECYMVNFSIKNAKCPNCGYVAPETDVDMNDLIFFKIGLLMSTGVKVENMLDL